MNVFAYELKAARTATMLWIVATLMLVSLYLSIYPAFAKDAAAFLELINNIPVAMQHIMGAGLDAMLFSFLGFFANVFPFITLIGAIQASILGFTMLSKEQLAKTTDFLFTKPITRASIFWQKVGAGACALLCTELAVAGGAFILANWFNAGNFDKGQFAMFWGAFAIIQFFMYSLCLVISQVVKNMKAVVPPALGLSFGLFLFALFALIIGDDTVRWLTPFRFIDYRRIITEGTYDPAHIMYAGVIIGAFIVVSYIIYTRKDVPAAV